MNYKTQERNVWLAAAHMARLFDGAACSPPYDWYAVKFALAEMFEKMAKDVK